MTLTLDDHTRELVDRIKRAREQLTEAHGYADEAWSKALRGGDVFEALIELGQRIHLAKWHTDKAMEELQ